MDEPSPIRVRIDEVLRKYGVKLADAPKDALVDAMERMWQSDLLRLEEMRKSRKPT